MELFSGLSIQGEKEGTEYEPPAEILHQAVPKSRLHQMNELILAGKSPKQAAHIAAPAENPNTMESALMKHTSIVDRNRAMFDKIGMREEEPYKVLFDIMKNAMKTAPITEGGVVVIKKMPDYTARLAAAKQVTTLMGLDPKAEMRIQVNQNGGGNSTTQILIGNAYIEIANHQNPDEQLAAYNEMQRNARQDGYRIIGDSSHEGKTMIEPNGSGVR